MTQFDRKKACKFQGLCDECIVNCPDREIQTHELRDNPDLTRIADALEKIARGLSRANELKALSLRHKYEIDNDHIDEIMEG